MSANRQKRPDPPSSDIINLIPQHHRTRRSKGGSDDDCERTRPIESQSHSSPTLLDDSTQDIEATCQQSVEESQSNSSLSLEDTVDLQNASPRPAIPQVVCSDYKHADQVLVQNLRLLDFKDQVIGMAAHGPFQLSHIRQDTTPPQLVATVEVPQDVSIHEIVPSHVHATLVTGDVAPVPASPWMRPWVLAVLFVVVGGVVLGLALGLQGRSTTPTVPTVSLQQEGSTAAFSENRPPRRPPDHEERRERTNAIVDYINSIKVSTVPITNRPVRGNGTPEAKAVQWLVDKDEMRLLPSTAIERFRLMQRYALLTLWFQSNGQVWRNKSGWATGEDECNWYGIECTQSPHDPEYGIQRVVTAIELPDNNFDGRIPADIALLRYIQVIDFSDNLSGEGKTTLYGSLPATLQNWHMLERFHLCQGQLTGTLPDWVGHWTSLEVFDVSGNNFSGSLPETIGQWSNMRQIDLQGNPFTGTIPETVLHWTSLETANLANTSFTGAFPCGSNTTNTTSTAVDCEEVECDCCTKCNRTV